MTCMCMEIPGVSEHSHSRAQNLSCSDVYNGSTFSSLENFTSLGDALAALNLGRRISRSS